jgi:hypothetical protein
MNPATSSFRLKMALASVASLIVMAYVDYITGTELIFSAAYILPVSLCAWHFGRPVVWLMSLAAGITSMLVDAYSGHTYSNSLVQYWNGFTCFLVCLVTGLLLHRLRYILSERKEMNNNLEKALEEQKRATEEIRKLQNGLQIVCAWTKQIKVGDKWMTPEEFLSTQLHLKLSHGMSPEGSRQFEEELKRHVENSNETVP